eukprot:CAMPEP_0178699474 /NCGR_PEP_ID=MMETSP0699-20121125/11092_1 /TAXON_ID=265572 /ORGANISM="Extubocellulus spinifer, Strain CCMP396" /LENGTH=431 /DNA_ID=CAMNT_0020345609 /DNA_START=8 /DNA_END=1303 /DNA_ORIENTATION=+
MPPNAHEETCVRERVSSWGQQVDISPLKGSTSTNTFATVSTSEDFPALLRLKDTLAAIPSRGYVSSKAPTPVEHMPRLAKLCGGPELYVKRDDLLPLAGGGSKTRNNITCFVWRELVSNSELLLSFICPYYLFFLHIADYLVEEAIESGADVLVTSGAVQSNHCRLTASAAAREGMECYIILEERIPGSYDPSAGGNNYAFSLLGAKQIHAPLGGVGPIQDDLIAKLKEEGKKPYVIPGGGSNQLGAVGYVRAAAELIEQSEILKDEAGESNKPGLFWDAIVTCSGSGGTHTGLLTGLRAAGVDTPVFGISVRFDADQQGDRIRQQVQACIDKYFSDFDTVADGIDDDVLIIDKHVGPGYSLPTDEMAESIQSFARLESIILDPVYTGKGAAGFLSLARSGKFDQEQRLLFIHTGGAPSLYHYQTLLSSKK